MPGLKELLGLIGDLLRELLPNWYVFGASQLTVSSPHDCAIGIVIQPGPQTTLETITQLSTYPMGAANLWGHTGMYVRQGRVARAVGYDPDRLRMFTVGLFTGETWRVPAGTAGTPGVIYDENVMFRSPDMICVEFPVRAHVATNLLVRMPRPGTPTDGLLLYVTRGGAKLPTTPPVLYGNCIDFVQRLLRQVNLRLAVVQGPGFGSAQGRLTRAALENNLVLQRRNRRPIRGTLIQVSGYLQLSRRVGGALRSAALVSGISSALATFGVPDVAEWVMTLVTDVVEALFGYFGYERDLSEFFLARTLFVVVILLDFLVETTSFHRLRQASKVLSTILTTGAVLAWVVVLTGNDEAMHQVLLSFALQVQLMLSWAL
jgi:hypothetical protein